MEYIINIERKAKEIFSKSDLQYFDVDSEIVFDSHNPSLDYGILYFKGEEIEDSGIYISMEIEYHRIDDNKFNIIISHPTIEQYRRNFNLLGNYIDVYKSVHIEIKNFAKAYNKLLEYITIEYADSNLRFKLIPESILEALK